MPYILLVCQHVLVLAGATVSLLLLGCSSVEEGQTQAKNMLTTATEGMVQGVETTKNVGEKMEATVLDVQERVGQLQNGVEKLQEGVQKAVDATSEFKEGVKEVKGAVSPSP